MAGEEFSCHNGRVALSTVPSYHAGVKRSSRISKKEKAKFSCRSWPGELYCITMKVSELETAVGGLSNPSKMPGLSYGTPAKDCPVGSMLRKLKGSVCSKCYAHKGMYVFPTVKEAQARRLEILSADLDAWRRNMTELLSRKYARKSGAEKVFRWHDSGDLQSEEHLSAIVQIAKDLPGIRFWIPTKEYGTVRRWIAKHGAFPENLAVRVSAPMIGREAAPIPGTVSSTVGSGTGFACEAYARGGKCGPCRACWNTEIPSVDYPQH